MEDNAHPQYDVTGFHNHLTYNIFIILNVDDVHMSQCPRHPVSMQSWGRLH